jgi:hypothetical protein
MLPFGITFTRPYAVPPPNELLRPLLGTPLNIRTRLPNNHSNKMPQAQPELKKVGLSLLPSCVFADNFSSTWRSGFTAKSTATAK